MSYGSDMVTDEQPAWDLSLFGQLARGTPRPPVKPRTRRQRRAKPPRTRQYARMRCVRALAAVLLATAFAMGITMLVMHGPAFFVFRSAGTGQTPSDGGLVENQGPGQPFAPGGAHAH